MATFAPTKKGAASGEATLPFGLKLGWATGALGVALLMNGIAGVIMPFSITMLGIDPWLAGLVILVSKLFDVVTDPVVGMWSDRHRSAQGRRRPFLPWGAALSTFSFAMLFAGPDFGNQYLSAAYLFVILCVYAFGYTLFNIPYMSMPAEMTDSYHERSSIQAFRMVFVALGSAIGGAGFKAALDFLGENEMSSWTLVGFAGAGIIVVSMIIAWLTTSTARFTEPPAKSTKSNLAQAVDEFGAVSSNRNFIRLICVKFAQLMGVQTMGAGFLYFFVQNLGSEFWVLGVFGLVVTGATILFSPLLVMLSKRYGKKATYYLAAAFNIMYALSWSLADQGEPIWSILARGLIVGVAFTGNVVMAMSMLTDIINEDAGRTGVRREGAFTALYSFVEKLTAAIAPFVVGIALTWAGFNKDLPFNAPQGENVYTVLLFSVSWLPSLFNLIAIWILSGYKLTQEQVAAAQDASKPKVFN